MPLVTLSPALRTLRGRIGDVVFKTYRDKVVMTRVPRFDDVTASPAQRARRDRIKEATAYAKRIYADPIAKQAYLIAARRLGRNAFRLAVSDYLHGTLLTTRARIVARRSNSSPTALPKRLERYA